MCFAYVSLASITKSWCLVNPLIILSNLFRWGDLLIQCCSIYPIHHLGSVPMPLSPRWEQKQMTQEISIHQLPGDSMTEEKRTLTSVFSLYSAHISCPLLSALLNRGPVDSPTHRPPLLQSPLPCGLYCRCSKYC